MGNHLQSHQTLDPQAVNYLSLRTTTWHLHSHEHHHHNSIQTRLCFPTIKRYLPPLSGVKGSGLMYLLTSPKDPGLGYLLISSEDPGLEYLQIFPEQLWLRIANLLLLPFDVLCTRISRRTKLHREPSAAYFLVAVSPLTLETAC